MQTKIFHISAEALEQKDARAEADLRAAGRILAEGGLVAFPTETVYGLGGNALDAQASARIYAAKGRPSDNPLIVHIAELSELEHIAREIPETALKLAARFWPGPLTMILKKSPAIPKETTGGLDTVAVRMPDHPAARALIRAAGVPVAAPSANTSGRPSPTTAAHVTEDLDGRIDALIDGGKVGIGLESTIVDLTSDVPVILRPGFVTEEDLVSVLGAIDLDPSLMQPPAADTAPKAPGMKYRHYAPKGQITIVEGSEEKMIERIRSLAAASCMAGERTGIITTKEHAPHYHEGTLYIAGSGQDMAEIGANLFRILRQLDADRMTAIYAEGFAAEGVGMAVMNRLMKAAAYRIVDADAE